MTNLVHSPKAPPRARTSRKSFPLSAFHFPLSPRSGLTLIEMLVALAVTLVMMAAVVNLFANMSGSIRNRRAAIETGAQLRQVRQRLALDLAGATCKGTTWQDPAENQGYIEIFEGENSDKDPTNMTIGVGLDIDPTTSSIPSSQAIDTTSGEVTDARALGDWDDILALTVRSESDPFSAPVDGNLVESPLAEVVWFARQIPADDPGTPQDESGGEEPGMRKIYRRVLLIAPWLGPWASRPDNVSVHENLATNEWIANTLGDLTKREFRTYHRYDNTNAANNFPHQMVGVNAGVDSLLLNNALAFDVRVFDPGAPLYESSGATLEPTDIGWAGAVSAGDPIVGYGAYCDLGWGWDEPAGTLLYPTALLAAGVPVPVFNIPRPAGHHASSYPLTEYPAIYDTWSYHYENDGIDQDPGNTLMPNIIDQGANGLDDDNQNGVDDRGERETAPPYDAPLRGVKVIFRVYEPDARQIRESSVTHSFKQ